MEESIIFKNVSTDKLKEIVIEATTEAVRRVLDSRKEAKYISRRTFSESRGISLPSIDKAIKRGDLKTVRIGGRVLIVDNEQQEKR